MYTFQTSALAFVLTLILLISTTSAAKIELSNDELIASAAKLQLFKDEQIALQIFREYIIDIPLEDYQLKDSYLMRWLRASEGNAFFAAQKLDEAQQWREDNNISAILDEALPRFPGYVVSKMGMDSEGRPILALSMKGIDLRKIIATGKKNMYFRRNFQILEKMAARARIISDLTGQEISKIYTIVDFEGYNKKQHACKECLETIVQFYKGALKYHPGLRFREVWINTPDIAAPLVKSIRTLYANTEEDLKIFGSDKAEWSRFLHKDIPADQLTLQFGGTQIQSRLLNAI